MVGRTDSKWVHEGFAKKCECRDLYRHCQGYLPASFYLTQAYQQSTPCGTTLNLRWGMYAVGPSGSNATRTELPSGGWTRASLLQMSWSEQAGISYEDTKGTLKIWPSCDEGHSRPRSRRYLWPVLPPLNRSSGLPTVLARTNSLQFNLPHIASFDNNFQLLEYNKTWYRVVEEYLKGNIALVLIFHMPQYSRRYDRLRIVFNPKK